MKKFGRLSRAQGGARQASKTRQSKARRADETRRGEAKRLDKTKRGKIGCWGKTRESRANAIKFHAELQNFSNEMKFHAELWQDREILRKISTAFYVAAKSCIEFRRNFTKS